MSPYERRRRGNALPSVPREDAPTQRSGKGALGTRRFRDPLQPEGNAALGRHGTRDQGGEQTGRVWSGCVSPLKLRRDTGRPSPDEWWCRGQNRTREMRPSGIAGGLGETWLMAELCTHLATERVRLATLRLQAHAPHFYPDNPPYGILGGAMETSASFEARSAPSSYSTA